MHPDPAMLKVAMALIMTTRGIPCIYYGTEQYLHNDTDTWFAEIPFNESAGQLITYRYVMLQEGQAPLRENIVPRRWMIASESTVKWRDTWIPGRES